MVSRQQSSNVQSNASAWSKGVRKKHSPPVQYEVDNQLMQPIAESQILTYSTEGREKMLKETKTFTLNFLQQTPEYRNSSVAGHSIHSGCEQSIEDKTMPRCTNVNTTLVYAPKFNKPPFKERQNEARSNSVSDSKQTATCSVSVQETFSDSMQKTSPNDSGPLFNMELKDLRSKNNSVRATRFYVVPAKRKKSQNESNASVQTHSNHDMESADKDLLMSQKHYVPNELDNSTHAVKHSRSVRKKYHRKPCSSAESKCATRLDDVSNKCPQEIVEINQCSSAEIRSDRRSHKPSQSQFRHKRPPRTTKELDRTRNRDVANYHDSESLEEIHPSRRNKTAVFKNRKWVPQQCSGFTDTLESEMISKRNDEYSESKCIKSSKAQLDRPELEFRNNIRIRRKNFDHKFKDFNSMIQPPPGFTEKPPGFTERIPPGITEKIPPGFTKKTPPGFTKKTPTGFTEKTPPGFIEKTPPGFTEKPPPGFTEKPPPGFTEKPPPGFTEKPPLSFTEKTPPGFTEKPPPGFTEKPPGFTEKPPLSFTEKPPLSFTEKPPPGFTEKPPPNFPSKVHWVKNRYGRTRGEKLNKGQFYRSQSMYHSSNRTGVTEDTDKITIQLDEISKCPSPKSEKCQQSIPFSSIHSGVLEANIHTRNLQFLLQKKCNQDATTDVIEAKNRSDANPLTSDLNIWQEKCVNGKYFETDQVTNNVPVISKRLKNLQLDDWTLQTAATSKSETSTSCSTPAVAMESHLTYDYWDLTYVNSEERDSHLPVKAPVSRSSITEIDGDLFSTTSTTSLVHCVAEDMRMSQGIAIDFRIRFGRVPELLSQNCRVGELAILTEPKHKPERFIYYLVTKSKSSTKPTIQNLENSLLCLREHCLQHHITHLAMPRIGCGLDLLVWSQVKDLLHKIFSDTVVSITVYNYNSESDEDVNVNIKHFCFKESLNCQLSEMVLGTGRVFLASESPMADSTMQDLNTKFLFMPTYVQNVRSKGGVFRYECKLPHEVLYGLIVRGCSIYESVDFLALDTSLRTLRKLIKKDNYLHIGIEAFYQEDDPFVMDKIITAIKWVFAKTDVELYICWSKTVMMQCGRTNT